MAGGLASTVGQICIAHPAGDNDHGSQPLVPAFINEYASDGSISRATT